MVTTEWVDDLRAPIPPGSVYRPDLVAWDMPAAPPGTCHAYHHQYAAPEREGPCHCGQRRLILDRDCDGDERLIDVLSPPRASRD